MEPMTTPTRMHLISHRTALGIAAIVLAAMTIALLALLLTPSATPVPRCEEDEVLVANDFPYTNSDNLHCEHIDNL
jgi:hypothetical protein